MSLPYGHAFGFKGKPVVVFRFDALKNKIVEDHSGWRVRKTMLGGSFSVPLLMGKEKNIGWSSRKEGVS